MEPVSQPIMKYT